MATSKNNRGLKKYFLSMDFLKILWHLRIVLKLLDFNFQLNPSSQQRTAYEKVHRPPPQDVNSISLFILRCLLMGSLVFVSSFHWWRTSSLIYDFPGLSFARDIDQFILSSVKTPCASYRFVSFFWTARTHCETYPLWELQARTAVCEASPLQRPRNTRLFHEM